MTDELILAVDQGTTNTKALLLDAAGLVVAEASVRVPIAFPRPGWVESDANGIWGTVQTAIAACTDGVDRSRIVAVAIANQRESVVAWERSTGRPLGPCVSWQCRRSTAFCDELRARGLEPLVRARTGLGIDPMFAASKARWLLDHIDDGIARAQRGEVCIGTVDSWLLWNLSGGRTFATDHTNAARTLLLDLDRLRWDEELLDAFGIPAVTLPALRASSAILGTTAGDGAIPAGVPVAGLIGDSHAALFGHGAPGPGTAKATYGTGTSVMAPVSRPVRSEVLSSTIAWSIETRDRPGEYEIVYALEGNILVTGAALQWLASIIGLEGREGALEGLASTVEDTGGVYIVPAFAGLGAPHWDADARGLISGLSRGTTTAHLCRAAFESIAYQVRDVLDALRAAIPTPLAALYADGGAMQADLLAQAQADLLDLPVLRTRSANLAAMGAGYLAGLAVGLWASEAEVRDLVRGFDRFEPKEDPGAWDERYRGWRAALRRAAGTLPPEPGTGLPVTPASPVPVGVGA
jgi:glycerol kinase